MHSWYVLMYKRGALWWGWGGKEGATVATQRRRDFQESTAIQNSIICILGVNKNATKFVTLVATYMYVIRLFKDLTVWHLYIYVIQRLRVKQDKVQFTAENYSVLCVWFVVCVCVCVCVVCGVWWMCGLWCVCVCGLWCVSYVSRRRRMRCNIGRSCFTAGLHSCRTSHKIPI